MIVASLLLILVAVMLLVSGLAGGSSLLLIGSIAASLLAAIALVVGARQAAAGRAGAEAGGEPVIPSQAGPGHPFRMTTGGRQPVGDPSGGGLSGQAGPAAAPIDEPGPQEVPSADAALVAQLGTDVLVIDGRPRYHLSTCPQLTDQESEPLPVREAVELGFTPCGRCEPDNTLLADARRD